MARGITESDVHGAADALVDAGERPTVERIRAHLGTGSPNTVTRWLETWWQGLGARLKAHTHRKDMPDVPEAVAALAGQWWGMALEYARIEASQALAADQAALQAAQDELRQARESFLIEANALSQRVDAAQHAEQLAQAQAVELQRLVVQLQAQVTQTTQQHTSALAQLDLAQATSQALQRQIQEQQEAFHREREQLAQHLRAVEDRSHQEIDRARQDAKELKGRLASMDKDHAAREKVLAGEAQRLNREYANAIQQAHVQQARAEALQAQLDQLKDLPATLESVLRKAAVPLPAKRARPRRAPTRKS